MCATDAKSHERIAVSGLPRRSYRLRESQAPTLMHSYVSYRYVLRFILHYHLTLQMDLPFNSDRVNVII